MLKDTLIHRGIICLFTLATWQYSAIAQDAVPTTNDDQVMASAGETPVYSGGVGDDEMNYIKSIQHQYDAKILFTANTGEYLSDMHVTIISKRGETLVDTITAGPVLLVNLPAGTYMVHASQNNHAISRDEKITVKGKALHTYQIRFPDADVISENN